MDKRGLTVDPNREAFTAVKWYDTLGHPTRPAPYATAAWKYVHDFVTESVTDTEPVDPTTWDGGPDFSQSLYDIILDAGLNFPDPAISEEFWDNGIFNELTDGLLDDEPSVINAVTTYFASVKVYDGLASAPGYAGVVDALLIDAFDDAVVSLQPIDPNDITIYDNGDVIIDPVPDPTAIYDGGTFAGLADDGRINLEEALYIFSNDSTLFRVQEILVDADDGGPLLTDPDGEEIDVGVFEGLNGDDNGKLLGEIHYEITGPILTITDWSHYNWHNSLPVEKAFAVMLKEAPECVNLVVVRDAPTAFWRKLGFRYVEKGNKTLVYDKLAQYVTTY